MRDVTDYISTVEVAAIAFSTQSPEVTALIPKKETAKLKAKLKKEKKNNIKMKK